MENKFIVANKGWAESIPEWILNEIKSERMMNGMIGVLKGRSEPSDVGNAEIVAYLMTESLCRPLHSTNQQIYLYLTSDLMKKCKGLTEETLPDFLRGLSLNDYEKGCLEDLRYKIFKARGKVEHPLFNILKEMKGGKK